MNKTMISILKVLSNHAEEIIGSREISRQLKQHGIELTERTVRYHLKIMDEKGLTTVHGKEGRQITEKGMKELKDSNVSARVGFIISKIETLAYQTTFDIDTQEGDIILNVSFFPKKILKEALKLMKPIFNSPYVMSDRVILAQEGERIGDLTIPKGMVGMGTVCSVTINGIFLKAGIPVVSRFGGLLQIEDGEPSRFISLISYDGSSLDPLLIFIKSRMTSILGATGKGNGNILASFREIPVVSAQKAKQIQNTLQSIGIGGILVIGNPNQPLFEMPVGLDRAGFIVVGGLNPIAALQEKNYETDSKAMAILANYHDLVPFNSL